MHIMLILLFATIVYGQSKFYTAQNNIRSKHGVRFVCLSCPVFCVFVKSCVLCVCLVHLESNPRILERVFACGIILIHRGKHNRHQTHFPDSVTRPPVILGFLNLSSLGFMNLSSFGFMNLSSFVSARRRLILGRISGGNEGGGVREWNNHVWRFSPGDQAGGPRGGLSEYLNAQP